MSMFKRNNSKNSPSNQAGLAELALENIHDGVIITDKNGVTQFINPAAVTMTEFASSDKAIGLDYGLLLKIESKEGRELSDAENPLIQAMDTGQALDSFQCCLIASQSGKRIPVAISVLIVDNANRIITFRNITKELAEEGEQTEFISTASHEMRTPVAAIDGYLSLALNPQTASIDARAQGYLVSAQKASQHLGKLFQDLLDVTKLDDGKIRPHFEPVEMTSLVKSISDGFITQAQESQINFTFGSDDTKTFSGDHKVGQVVYGYVDVNFMHEILDNLIENAIKYTPDGGSIYVNVRGDGDKVLINVTDTGIGISADDLGHIFQKFYRADNSDTRTIGGTGLGLYLVKQRVEAMGGRVWAESAFGEGSTFYVSLPRISIDEYEKRMIAVRNQQMRPNPQPASTPGHTTTYAPRPIPAQPAPVQPVAPRPQSPTGSSIPPQPPISSLPPVPPAQAPPAPPIPPTQSPPVTPPTPQPLQPQINNNLNGVQQ